MKLNVFQLAILIAVAISVNCKPNLVISRQSQSLATNQFINHISNNNVGISFCKTCINFAGDAIDELLNAVLNLGIVGSCVDICQYVAQQTGSEIAGVVCNLLCDYVGISEFIKAIEHADLDPIFYCELLKACPINDNGDAKITSFVTTPTSGPVGTNFVARIDYVSLNGTGTGELVIEIGTVDHIPVAAAFLIEAQKPGKYRDMITIHAAPDPHCDPTQQPCERWLPGNYQVKIALCNGECGSKHPHSKIYDEATTKFVITN